MITCVISGDSSNATMTASHLQQGATYTLSVWNNTNGTTGEDTVTANSSHSGSVSVANAGPGEYMGEVRHDGVIVATCSNTLA